MSSNALLPGPSDPRRPGRGTLQIVVDSPMRLIHDQIPATLIAGGAVLTAALVKQVIELLKKNISTLLGSGLIAAGLAMLLPSFTVAMVNVMGFTAAGILKGSLAALIQSAVYGGATSGAFSTVQAFGATAAIAHPAVLGVGVTILVIGAGIMGYKWYKNRQRRAGNNGSGDNDDDDPKETRTLIKRQPRSNFFSLFR